MSRRFYVFFISWLYISFSVFLTCKLLLFGLFYDSFCGTFATALLFLLCSIFAILELKKENPISTCAFLIGFIPPNVVNLFLFVSAYFSFKKSLGDIFLLALVCFFLPCALILLLDRKKK